MDVKSAKKLFVVITSSLILYTNRLIALLKSPLRVVVIRYVFNVFSIITIIIIIIIIIVVIIVIIN